MKTYTITVDGKIYSRKTSDKAYRFAIAARYITEHGWVDGVGYTKLDTPEIGEWIVSFHKDYKTEGRRVDALRANCGFGEEVEIREFTPTCVEDEAAKPILVKLTKAELESLLNGCRSAMRTNHVIWNEFDSARAKLSDALESVEVSA